MSFMDHLAELRTRLLRMVYGIVIAAIACVSFSKPLWEFDTSQEFETVNRMVAHGGAISTSGAVIVDGMVYVGSGYAVGTGATAGNVLLAFGID